MKKRTRFPLTAFPCSGLVNVLIVKTVSSDDRSDTNKALMTTPTRKVTMLMSLPSTDTG